MSRDEHDRILQVRVPPDLRDRITAYLAHLRESDPTATESMAVRHLLRAALGYAGLGTNADAAGFNEGLRRGYAEVRSAIREALRKFFHEVEAP